MRLLRTAPPEARVSGRVVRQPRMLPAGTPLSIRVVFVLFAASIVFSLLGFILLASTPRIIAWVGPLLPWFMRVPTWIYMIGLPVLVALMYLPDLGASRTLQCVALASGVGLVVELVGTNTGIPFGPYRYTSFLDPKLLGDVPVLIPLSWFGVSLISYDLARRTGLGRAGRIAAGALFLMLWDVALDPAMSRGFPVWRWEVYGAYYGMPLLNWAGWFLTGLVIAAGYEMLGFDQHARPSPLAKRLWVLNGAFPVGVCAIQGMGVAAIVGTAAIALPIVAVRRRGPAVARASA